MHKRMNKLSPPHYLFPGTLSLHKNVAVLGKEIGYDWDSLDLLINDIFLSDFFEKYFIAVADEKYFYHSNCLLLFARKCPVLRDISRLWLNCCLLVN